MPYAILALSILFFSSISAQPIKGYGVDSLVLREIADSLHVPITTNTAWVEGGRVTRLSIFYGNQHGAIPPALGRLDSLHYLFMGITRVTSLPREIGLLKRMDTIDIGSSLIGPALPEEIGDLPNLRYLNVSVCSSLKSLPKSLMRLKKLEFVNFSLDSICGVDDSLRNWILAINPKALDNQGECAATGIRDGKSFHGNNPLRKLAPGERSGPNRDPQGKIRYYSPAGRRLRTEKAGPGV
ncbi:MAG: hypothetical protein JF616_14565 [Fibrobacteres bacterium]|nr:hypothetical protein [Fibrobacterota bacterium]